MEIIVFVTIIGVVYGIMYVIISGLLDLVIAGGKRVFSFFKTKTCQHYLK